MKYRNSTKQTLTTGSAASLKAADDTNPRERAFEEGDVSVEVWCALTLVYIVFEVARLAEDTEDGEALQLEVGMLPTGKYIVTG